MILFIGYIKILTDMISKYVNNWIMYQEIQN